MITLPGRQNNLAVPLIGCMGSITVLLEEPSIAPPHHLNLSKNRERICIFHLSEIFMSEKNIQGC